MLISKNLEEKTYQEMVLEAMTQIPLYSSEWTNFNQSDPGITILENLTAFAALQQKSINTITPAIKQKLLKMVGFEAQKGRCARTLLAPVNQNNPIHLTNYQKFTIGDLSYETNRAIDLEQCHLTGVYSKRGKEYEDFTNLIVDELPVPTRIFTEKPEVGDSLYLVSNQLPQPGEEVYFYLTVANRYNRNPFETSDSNHFAHLEWECYTEKGYEPIHVKDNTGCFLISGEIRMRMPDHLPALCPEVTQMPGAGEGYVIRATLTYADYDISPKILSLKGFLFEAWQKDTKAAGYTFQQMSKVEIHNQLMDFGYFLVFAKEEKGSSYHRYLQSPSDEEEGRYFDFKQKGKTDYQISFDRKKHGFGPEKLKNPVKVMVYSEELMRTYFLGKVLGYDNQMMSLPVQNIVADSFCIIARRERANGEEIFDFVRPSRHGADDLTYYLYENDGTIEIEDAGPFIGADLYIGSCSVTKGAKGNIRENNRFLTTGDYGTMEFYNPGPGTGGCYRESIQDVRTRFLQDLDKPYTAVTASDYEKIIQQTPGLCIHKVKAMMNQNDNFVRIAVKPDTDEDFPGLSATYRKILYEELNHRRLLTTRVEIVSPEYLAVNARGVVYVKPHYEKKTELIEDTIRKKMDYIHSNKNFGEVLSFSEVFHEIEELDCVDYVYELYLYPFDRSLGQVQDLDICPNDNCLCYAGDIKLEIRTQEN